ncbi:MAG TPA: tRNA (N(6)-L-threonylcarbamoyladenosine(37)-C(2))-methylthiotransferase MtaB [Dehalococcoidia bacterium]|nr:tRNA (N(6)-L-threonylcarbamoyladenosine(37)-C(2))-methylthiotransferase MtaB [Dehalococcoidia bacterium]
MTVEEGWSSLGTVALQTVGCKLNQAETDSLARKFLEAGYQVVAHDYAADIYLLNTCTVTHIADRKCRKLLRLAHRRNPGALIVATGCYAQRAPREIASIEGVELVIGNRDKHRLVEIIEDTYSSHRACSKVTETESTLLRTRALLRIQEGCSQPCSFCIVPRVRGPERSRPREEIITEVKDRVAEGYKEVILTGTRIGCYGQDKSLPELIKRILKESELPRLRLSSLEPADLTPDLLALWEDNRLCPHIHLPLQSGSDSVLERMGRVYSTPDYLRAASLAREAIPHLSLTTDIMVGFPGESEQEFIESYRFCERIGFAGIHVFPYSPRPDTRAARMENTIADGERKQRSLLMLDLARSSGQRFREQFLGRNMNVLWEGKKDGIWFGLTDNYFRVFLPSKELVANKLLSTNMVAQKENGLWGELITQGLKS